MEIKCNILILTNSTYITILLHIILLLKFIDSLLATMQIFILQNLENLKANVRF